MLVVDEVLAQGLEAYSSSGYRIWLFRLPEHCHFPLEVFIARDLKFTVHEKSIEFWLNGQYNRDN